MSLVVILLLIALGLGLALFFQAIRTAPVGEENEDGFISEPLANRARYLKAERLVNAGTTRLRNPGVHAA